MHACLLLQKSLGLAFTLAGELHLEKVGKLALVSWWLSGKTIGSLRRGQQVGAGRERGHTPRIPSKVQQRAPIHAPLRAGQAPSRRRAAAGGGSGPRFLSPGLRASSHRSPGELRLAATDQPAASPCALAPPRALLRGSRRGGVGAGPTRAEPPSGPSPGQPSLPPRQPLAAQPPGCGARATPRGPQSNARGGPRRPARRPQIEPRWRRSEAELCRGRASYIVSSPRTPSHPFPPPFFPPRPGLRGWPPACLAVLPPPIFASIHLFVPHPLGTPAPLPSPLASWTVLQAANADRGEVAWTAVPRESSNGTK